MRGVSECWLSLALISAAGCAQPRAASSPEPTAAPVENPSRGSEDLDRPAEVVPSSDAGETERGSAVVEQVPVTTVQDPELGQRLDPATPLDPYFVSTPDLRRRVVLARRMVSEVANNLRSGTWTVELRTGCPHEDDGRVVVVGRALVRDTSHRVRTLSEHSGSDDSAGDWKLYYDEAGRLRVVRSRWANYMGWKADVVAIIDEAGVVESCSSKQGDSAGWFCPVEEPSEPPLDPDVAEAVGDGKRSRERREASFLGYLQTLDPLVEFSKCTVAYEPAK